ncbi:MAG: energy transducer TonB [Bacteroidetes bacterium]|nr:energy transducer TonB [Bacteroidota bacterium]MCL2303408.1 energy transducer TonB [Lentimicrobiaceae bacterium]
MNSKLFSFKSIALLGVALLYMATGVAQNNPKSTNEEQRPPDLIINLTNIVPTQENPEGTPVQAVKMEFTANGSVVQREVEITDANSPFMAPSEPPIYIDGRRGFIDQIASATRYPASLLKDKVQGIVVVQVIVEKDGSFNSPTVIAPVHPKLDEEALRVVSTLKSFNPGKNNGEVVRSYTQIPVPFLLSQKR